MLIKVARLGTTVVEVMIADGGTVQDAINAADLVVEKEEIRVGGRTANLSTVLSNGSVVTLVPMVKGGQNIVKVARLGTQVQEVVVSDTATVQDALDAADITIENEEIRMDGASVSTSTSVRNNSVITIVPKVKGGK